MYAETDFYLALLKDDDWLKKNALRIYDQYKYEIWTSQMTIQELLLYTNKYKKDPVAILDSFYNITEDVREVNMSQSFFLFSTHIMSRYGATPFDAMHAAAAQEDGTIISSDSIYDKIGLKRIKLEEKP